MGSAPREGAGSGSDSEATASKSKATAGATAAAAAEEGEEVSSKAADALADSLGGAKLADDKAAA